MADNSETIDEVVGIKLELDSFEIDPTLALDEFFKKVQEAATKQKWSNGGIAQAMADTLAKLQGQAAERQWDTGLMGQAFSEALAAGKAKINSFIDSIGIGKLARDVEAGEMSKSLFQQFVMPRGGLDDIENWFRRGIIDKNQYLQHKIPASTLSELRNFYQKGDIDRDTFLRYADAQVAATGRTGFREWAARMDNRLVQSPEALEFKKRWDDAALSVGRFVVSLRAMEQPFRSIYRFTDRLREMNTQFALMAQHANMAASDLAAQSGLFAAFGGGSGRGFANYANAFTMAMEQRRIGLGDGGQFTRAMMHYGIKFNANSLEETTRNIVAFMSDPTRTDAQKLSAGRMLGWDDSMIAAAKRGNAFYSEYTAEMAALTTHKSPATEAALELSLETNKLKAAFGDLKDMLFESVSPAVTKVVQGLTRMFKFLNDHPWVTKLATAAGLLWMAAKALVLAKFTWGAGKMALGGIFRMLTGGVAGGALNVAGGAVQAGMAGAGGTIAGISRMTTVPVGAGGAAGSIAGGGLGMIFGAVDAVAGTVQRQIQIHSLTKLDEVVDKWHREWIGYTLSRGGTVTKRLGLHARELDIDKRFLDAGKNQFLLDYKNVLATSQLRDANGGGRGGVIVEHMTFSVNTQASEPAAVAEEVKRVMMNELSVLAFEEGGRVA